MKGIVRTLSILVFLFIGCNSNTNESEISSGKEELNDKDNFRQREGTRQIHLDFHTSEWITDVGVSFDKKQFQDALIAGNVNSINVFAKGHHGWSYYPTEVGSMHPNLDFDLLGAQIEACHEIGIRVQAYFAVGWSQKDAREHPEWAIKDQEGFAFTFLGQRVKDITPLNPSDPLPNTYWTLLSPERGYLELILKQTEELVSNYDLDGIWYDIIPVNDINFSDESIADMENKGIDISDKIAMNTYHVDKMELFFESANAVVKKHLPDASIFYNWSTHINYKNPFLFELYKYNTKQDLEDLPTTWDGYDLFPLRVKYFANTGDDMVGMSGKFHTSWGEFGGFKYKDAIKYEAATMISFGARANFGDQLHPSGVLEIETYENIGYAFDYVEKIEEYGIKSIDIASLGIWMTLSKQHDEGTVKMLLENQVDFVIANNLEDWSNLETIILNGATFLLPEEKERILDFLTKGGSLLVMGEGTLDKDKGKFQLDLGVDYLGPADYDIDFTLVSEEISQNLPVSPFLNYDPAIRVKAGSGSKILASIREPYFSRTLEHYTSHRNTPYKLEDAPHPDVVQTGNIIYMAHSLGKLYFENGARVHRELFYNVLQRVHQQPMIQVEMPSAGRINLLHQPQHRRYIAHLLYGTPHQRGIAQVIEDMVPIYDIQLQVNVPQTIIKAYSIPNNDQLDFKIKDGNLNTIVPKLQCHTAIVFEY